MTFYASSFIFPLERPQNYHLSVFSLLKAGKSWIIWIISFACFQRLVFSFLKLTLETEARWSKYHLQWLIISYRNFKLHECKYANILLKSKIFDDASEFSYLQCISHHNTPLVLFRLKISIFMMTRRIDGTFVNM